MKDSNFKISMKLIVLVKEMIKYIMLAVLLGILGFLCAIFIPILGAYGIEKIISGKSFELIIITILILAILRGILRYGEQALNHYVAFKTLAILRDKVFKKLRELTPAKLDGKDKGNLISLITTDVELLEVFYAHTISPVMIWIGVSIIISLLLLSINFMFTIIYILASLIIGVFIPFYISKKGKVKGQEVRENEANVSDLLIESFQGINDLQQFSSIKEHKKKVKEAGKTLNKSQKEMRNLEGDSTGLNNTIILLSGLAVIFMGAFLKEQGQINQMELIIAFIITLSSFGPVVAISNLSNNLLLTFASAKRILNLLEEKPQVYEIKGKQELQSGDISIKNLNFSYGDNQILKNVNLKIKENKITGIKGESGLGKSTLLKLLMRYYIANTGEIKYKDINISEINSSSLREGIAYMNQETFLFNTTIKENIKIANLKASEEDIKEACKKAAIDEFIEELPNKYETIIGENGSRLSEGQKQRLGLARIFLTNSKYIFLDEPTANVDSLNEDLILNQIKKIKGKTIVLISHQKSTLNICDEIINLKEEIDE